MIALIPRRPWSTTTKGDVYEGGVRVPFVVKWPAKLPAGKTYDLPISSLDIFATALGVAGIAMPTDRKYDSVNLTPFLSGDESSAPHDQLFWRTSRNIWAVRRGNAKLVRQVGKADELYDLQADIGETSDLQATRPNDASRLGAELDAWNKGLLPPAFPGAPGGKKATKAKAD